MKWLEGTNQNNERWHESEPTAAPAVDLFSRRAGTMRGTSRTSSMKHFTLTPTASNLGSFRGLGQSLCVQSHMIVAPEVQTAQFPPTSISPRRALPYGHLFHNHVFPRVRLLMTQLCSFTSNVAATKKRTETGAWYATREGSI